MNINRLFNELNDQRTKKGKDNITREEFIEVISAMGVRGEVINTGGEIFSMRPVQVELAQSRLNHIKKIMQSPEIT